MPSPSTPEVQAPSPPAGRDKGSGGRHNPRSSPPQEEADSTYHDASSQSIKESKVAYPYRPPDSKPLPALPSSQTSTCPTPRSNSPDDSRETEWVNISHSQVSNLPDHPNVQKSSSSIRSVRAPVVDFLRTLCRWLIGGRSSSKQHNPSLPTSPRDYEASQPTSEPPVMIAVMGATGSGKSSFINLASGSNLRVGMGLESCTAEVKFADVFTLDGRAVILIDTPGFDDTTKSDADILEMIAAFLATLYEKGSKISGIIYIHRISDKRFTGVAGRNFSMLCELCGNEALKNVVLVTNMWGEVSPEAGEDREKQLSNKFFKPALDNGAQLARHQNTSQSAHDIIQRIMGNRPVVLQIQWELVDEQQDIVRTAAGGAVNRELKEQMRRHQDELEGIQKDIEQALKEKDEQTRQELEEDRRRLQEQVDKVRQDSERMALNYAAERRRMEARMGEIEQEAIERERAEAEHY